MKFTHLICLAVATVVSSQAFALEIFKGKVTHHKEWGTGGAKGKFVSDFTRTSNMKMRRNNQPSSNDSFASFSGTNSYSARTSTNQPTPLLQNNYVSIINQTDENQSYTYTFGACGQDSKEVVQCLFAENTVELEPGGSFDDASHPTLELTWTKPGRYLIESVTQVLEPNIHHGMNTSVATMIVS